MILPFRFVDAFQSLLFWNLYLDPFQGLLQTQTYVEFQSLLFWNLYLDTLGISKIHDEEIGFNPYYSGICI